MPPSLTTSWQRCRLVSTRAVFCPLCQRAVPAHTEHECESNGGVVSVRNRPVAQADVMTEALKEL